MPVEDVELLVLGSGTSAGVPVIGCACETCTSDDPRDRRLRTSACLQFTGGDGARRAVLVDTSPDLREQALRHGLRRCDAIVYTHHHVDHVFGLDEVRRFNAIMQAPIDVYADAPTMEALRRVFRHIFDRDRNANDSFVATLVPCLVDPARPFVVHGLRFTPVPLLHGRMPLLGYRVDAVDERGAPVPDPPPPLPLAWCTDVSAIPPGSWSLLAGLRTLVLDMLRYRKHPTHFTVDEAVDAAARIEAERTWFVHMTHDIRHADLDPRLPGGLALAHDGLRIGYAAFLDPQPPRARRGA